MCYDWPSQDRQFSWINVNAVVRCWHTGLCETATSSYVAISWFLGRNCCLPPVYRCKHLSDGGDVLRNPKTPSCQCYFVLKHFLMSWISLKLIFLVFHVFYESALTAAIYNLVAVRPIHSNNDCSSCIHIQVWTLPFFK